MNICLVFEKFNKKLLSKKEFYSLLSDKGVSNKENQHVLKVCNKLKMKAMEDYHNINLICDVLLSADVFEEIKNRCIKHYGLCPSHYLSESALRWDTMLNMTKVEIQ